MHLRVSEEAGGTRMQRAQGARQMSRERGLGSTLSGRGATAGLQAEGTCALLSCFSGCCVESRVGWSGQTEGATVVMEAYCLPDLSKVPSSWVSVYI